MNTFVPNKSAGIVVIAFAFATEETSNVLSNILRNVVPLDVSMFANKPDGIVSLSVIEFL